MPGPAGFPGHRKIFRNRNPAGCADGRRGVAARLRKSLRPFEIFMIVNVLVGEPGDGNKASRLPGGIRGTAGHSGWCECLTWPNLFSLLVCNRLYTGVWWFSQIVSVQ